MMSNPLRLLHLSDLHRTGDDPLTNSELLNGIGLDLGQMAQLGDDFTKPDAIVVSGDLVQGVSSSSPTPEEELERQNQEALRFLSDLADSFVAGDRARVIILPGNHDVERATAKKAMERVEAGKEPRNLGKELTKTSTRYRWCWRDRCVYEIVDLELYDKKLDAYRKTATSFYEGVAFPIDFDAARPWNHFPISDDVLITAFDNCQHIDGFRFAASVHPKDVADANIALGKASMSPKLKIATWHHNINGPPLKNDYLDADELCSMLNSGYRIGLHGHQHLPDAVPFSLHTSSDQKMAVVSVGSLGASDADIAPGCRQQFSVLAIDVQQSSGRLWIREMISRGVFGPGRIRSRSSEIYADIEWTPAPIVPIVRTSNHGGIVVETADKIELLLAEKKPQQALPLIKKYQESLGSYGRSLQIRCLQLDEAWLDLVNLLTPPRSIEETTYLVKAHMTLKQSAEALATIDRASEAEVISSKYANELRNWIKYGGSR